MRAWLVPGGFAVSAALPGAVLAAEAESKPADLGKYVVTASRVSNDLGFVPASVTVVDGDTLRARGATTLSEALAGVAGVEVSPGGDGGPAGSVPALWGLREVDAFLLVIDGVPAGGAFNPALTTVDLNNVERIEIMRGAAPVMYGATSFVGVIHIIHYPAGESAQRAWISGGGPAGHLGSFSVGGTTALRNRGATRRSISGSVEQTNLADDDAGYLRAHTNYRSSRDTDQGSKWMDVDLGLVHQKPDSPVVFENGKPTTATPLDANHNPSDAVYDEARAQFNFGRSRREGDRSHESMVSVALSGAHIIRGFLESPENPAPNADGYEQTRGEVDVYLDHHTSLPWGRKAHLVYGADALLGYAGQKNDLYEYTVSLDGGDRPSLKSGNKTKGGEAYDGRAFGGLYAQSDWQIAPELSLFTGLRLNLTYEARKGEREEELDGNGVVDKPDGEIEEEVHDTNLRLTGTLGSSWRFWHDGRDQLVAFADYRNSFKPAAFEFAPESEAEILSPETANSYELGLHSQLAGGRLGIETSAFWMDFDNVLVAESGGAFNLGATRLRGAEIEIDWHLTERWRVLGSYSYHDAQIRRGMSPDGDDLSGKQMPMSPHQLASAGLMYEGATGLFGNVMMNYVGARELDEDNSGKAGAYKTVDARLGYRRGAWTLALTGRNLSDRRDLVSQSEFSEVTTTEAPETQPAEGVTAHYRLPARSVELGLTMAF
nr:TonB-dependent receptor [Solimonas marina]